MGDLKKWEDPSNGGGLDDFEMGGAGAVETPLRNMILAFSI